MRDQSKTKQQLIAELEALREQLAARADAAGQADADAHLPRLLELIPVPVLISRRADGQILDANDSFCEFFGIQRDQLATTSALDFYVDTDLRSVLVERLKTRPQIDNLELQVKRPDQPLTWALISIRPITYRGEAALLSVVRDITRRRQMEDTLSDQHNRLQSIIENSGNGIVLVDQQGIIVEWNPAMAGITGLSYAQVLGRPAHEVIPGLWINQAGTAYLTPAECAEMIRSAIEQGEQSSYFQPFATQLIQRPDGLRRTLEINSFTIKADQGHMLGMVASDVTNRQRMEEALRQSEARFRAAFEQAAVGMATVAPDTSILQANRRLCEMLGYSADELLQMKVGDVTYPDDLPANDERRAQIAAGEIESFTLEKRYIRKDGSLIWASLTVSGIRTPDGQIDSYMSVIEDITERKQAEQAEREQRALAETLRDTAAALNSTLDLDEVFDRILDNVRRVLPYDAAYLLRIEADAAVQVRRRQMTEPSLPSQEGRQRLPLDLPTVRHLLTGQSLAIPDVQAYPGWVPFEKWPRSYVAAPIIIEGQVAGILDLLSATPGFYNETHTDRLRAFADQAAIAMQNARLYGESQARARQLALLNLIARAGTSDLGLADLLHTLADMAAGIIGGDGCYITVWDSERRLAYPGGAYGAMREQYMAEVPIPGEKTLTEACLIAGKPVAIDNVRETDLIDPHVVATYPKRGALGLPLHAGGRDLGALIIAFDEPHRFTEDEIAWAEQVAELVALAMAKGQAHADLEKRVEERTTELREAHASVVKLAEVKDEFIANVSHELRTPLTNLKLYHHLLRTRPEKTDHYLPTLARETRRLEYVVEQMLRITDMSKARSDLQPITLDLSDLVRHYVADMGLLAEERGLALTFRGREGLPSIQADPGQLERALGVLVGNAINYTPEGGRIEVETGRANHDGREGLTLTVVDSGPGIPADELPRLCDRFFRGRIALKLGVPGAGLGLFIARAIAERHGGRLEARDGGLDGAGATFTIWLPVEQQPATSSEQ